MPEELKCEFEIIPGKNNIILVAPHGYPGDDDYTAELTKSLAQMLNSYAVINKEYRRTRLIGKKKKREPIDLSINKVDLNYIPQVKKAGLEEKWLGTINGLKQDILKRHAHCFAFFIHGAEDDNVKEVNDQADILLGVGRVKAGSGKEDRPTATDDTIEQLIRFLKDEGSNITAVVAKAAKKDSDDIENRYAGQSNHNLNQYFVKRVDGILEKAVQAIQLEFKKTGFRDTEDNVEATVDKLALAIQQLPGVAPAVEQVIDVGKEVATIPARMEIVSDPEVIQAADKIIEIFHDKISSGLIDVGNMLLKQFFNDSFEAVRTRKKGEDFPSILQIRRELESRGIKSISKSWLYNAINVAADSKYIEGKKDNKGRDFFDFHTYGLLPASHKVLLERVRDDDEEKRDLILETGKNNYSFVELKNKIAEVKGLPAPVKKSAVLRVANNPAKLFSGDYDSDLKLGALKAMRPSTRKKLKDKVEKAVKRQKQYLDRFKKLANQLEKIPDEVVQKKEKAKR